MNNKRFHFGFRISDCGLACATRSPQRRSAIRQAVTLLEVLISMAILTVGILGVAALFPVGSFYMLRAEIYERADAAAAQAFNDAVTRGLLDPERWVSYETGRQSMSALATYTPPGVEDTFTRPYALDMRNRRALLARTSFGGDAVAQRQQHLVSECGSILFIDPVGVARGIDQDPTSSNVYAADPGLGAVPASIKTSGGGTGDYLQVTPAPGQSQSYWEPWIGQRPLVRITMSRSGVASSPSQPLSVSGAERLASVQDDLAYDVPDNAEQPSRQQWSTSTNLPGAVNRLAKSHYSFIITVAPNTSEAWHQIADGGRGQTYDVSAVVLYRRPPNGYDSSLPLGGIENTMRAERMCRASIVSTGTSGGEVQLFSDPWAQDTLLTNNPKDKHEWETLKPGAYVFLFGPHPNSTPRRPMLFGQWYRTIAVDDSTTGTGPTSGPTVALRGPDWPWGGGSPNMLPRDLRDDLKMLILDGAVAVHTRTMRLDAGTAWREQ